MNRELIECLAKARYLSKRNAGIGATRSDGSECSVENDIDATGAEFYASQQLKQPFDAGVGAQGDGGADFSLQLDVEVIWLGKDKKTGEPRTTGNLIVNPHEPQRWADIYVVVAGSVETGFKEVGWATHKQLLRQPMVDFGFGTRYAIHVDKLNKPETLKNLVKDL